MILAIPEYDSHPALPAQWDRYYNRLDDNIYIQTVISTDLAYPNWEAISTGAVVREDTRVTDTLVRSKLSGKDYQTYLDQGVAWLAENYADDFNDFMSSDPAILFIEYVSAALDQMSWYLDREVDEWYPELARLKSNIAQMCRYLGYKATPSVSAGVDLTVTLSEGPYGFDVPLRRRHRFEGPNSLVYEVDSDQTISAGDTTKDITVYQGQSFTEVFTSDGTAKQIFNLSLVPAEYFLAQGYNVCSVDGSSWSEEDFLPYSNTDAFEINYLNSPPQLRFGDGIVGRIPPSGSEIRITYIATAGKAGMLATAGTITTSVTPVVVNFQTIPISVTNSSPASGGADPESSESIVANAPRYYDAADRVVTKGDIETLAGHFSDSLYGAVAMANATSIRGASQDLELADLLDALTADRTNLTTYLNNISAQLVLISDTYVGATGVSNSIRWVADQNDTLSASIKTETASVDGTVASVQSSISDIESDIDLAKSRLDFLPFQDIIARGDGSTLVFSNSLSKSPVQEGSAAVFIASQSASHTASNGDCDATPGRLIATMSPVFASTDVGKIVRIGGEYRQVLKFISTTTIEYTGPRIYGTSLICEMFPPAVIGYDDGAGNISGTGITGTIAYSNGAVNLTFTTAPEGLSGKYGVPIVCTYQWNGDGIKAVLDNALVDCGTADTNVGTITTNTGTIDTHADSIVANNVISGDTCDSIDDSVALSNSNIDSALVIPDQISNDITALNTYLDSVISGECKANILRISILVEDSNGFYTAPSISLIGSLRTYLDSRRIESVRYSVVDGSYNLLKVTFTVGIKVLSQYVYQDVSELVLAALNDLLKGRGHGVGLLRKQYYDAVNDIDGIDYINIEIMEDSSPVSPLTESPRWGNAANTSSVPLVDSNGNLFVSDDVVITKDDATSRGIIISEIV